MTAALELQGITKSYDTVQVLQKINLTVGRRIHLPVGPLGLRENHFAQNHCRAS